jgi:copper(I)-binding protein
MHHHTLRVAATLGAATLALTLSACGSTTDSTATPSGSGTTAPSSPASATPLTLLDGWAKATEGSTGDMASMTGVFGMLKNTGTEPVHITGGMSPVASMVETHITVKGADGVMKMQKAADGFTIPAGGTFELKPGANHIMLMGLHHPLKVGEKVEVELTTDSGPVTIEASARAFSGANESYHATPMPSHS